MDSVMAPSQGLTAVVTAIPVQTATTVVKLRIVRAPCVRMDSADQRVVRMQRLMEMRPMWTVVECAHHVMTCLGVVITPIVQVKSA